MKRLVVVCALGLGIGVPLAATAARADAPAAQVAPTAKPAQPTAPSDVAPPPPDDGEHSMPGPEILHEKPSGFWTSNRPAVGGAYRYRLLLLGVVVAGLMAWLMIRTVKRHARHG